MILDALFTKACRWEQPLVCSLPAFRRAPAYLEVRGWRKQCLPSLPHNRRGGSPGARVAQPDVITVGGRHRHHESPLTGLGILRLLCCAIDP
jgi:hypothetical protein